MIIFYCVAIFECCSHPRCFWLPEWIYCFSCYHSGPCEVVFKSSLPLKKCVVSIKRYVSLIKLTIVFIITTLDFFRNKTHHPQVKVIFDIIMTRLFFFVTINSGVNRPEWTISSEPWGVNHREWTIRSWDTCCAATLENKKTLSENLLKRKTATINLVSTRPTHQWCGATSNWLGFKIKKIVRNIIKTKSNNNQPLNTGGQLTNDAEWPP